MTLVVVSDVHSCYDSLIQALDKVHYDKEDGNQKLVFCGDLFDRGPQPIETYRFIRSIPKEHRILIKGNHEDLLHRALKTGDVSSADMQNGTIGTLQAFANMPNCRDGLALSFSVADNYPLLAWLESEEWLDFYEAGPYLFVHAGFPTLGTKPDGTEVAQDFRSPAKGVRLYWEAARWHNPLQFSKSPDFEKEKANGTVLVAGHRPNDRYWKSDKYDIFFDDHFIGMDGGCHYSGKMNVLLIDTTSWKAEVGN